MESLAGDLRQMQRTPLHDEHVVAMRRVGEVRHYAKGHRIVEMGESMDRFAYPSV
jgi:thioredoxin reductase (NADPH)